MDKKILLEVILENCSRNKDKYSKKDILNKFNINSENYSYIMESLKADGFFKYAENSIKKNNNEIESAFDGPVLTSSNGFLGSIVPPPTLTLKYKSRRKPGITSEELQEQQEKLQEGIKERMIQLTKNYAFEVDMTTPTETTINGLTYSKF